MITAISISLFFVVKVGFEARANPKVPEMKYSLQRPEVYIPPPFSILLGQNFIIGIPGKTLDEKTENIIRHIQPAGVILYYRNYQTQDQLKRLIFDLQKIAKSLRSYPYFIMIDEEPGGASRLDLFNNIFSFGEPEWDRIEKDIKLMASLGINVDLAPLADFPFNDDTFIKRRVMAHTADALIDFNGKFISLLDKHHIFSTLKHFPGMGIFREDPHVKLPYTNADKKIINESIRIFKKGIDSGAGFVMTGHAVYDNIDPNTPATLSHKITTEILRNDLAFSGLAITDDLSDMPFMFGKSIDLPKATAKSLKAGHNLVIYSHKLKKTKEIFEELLQQMQHDDKLRLTVEDNYGKVMSFKRNYLLGSSK